MNGLRICVCLTEICRVCKWMLLTAATKDLGCYQVCCLHFLLKNVSNCPMECAALISPGDLGMPRFT